jgi:hypothetical protein
MPIAMTSCTASAILKETPKKRKRVSLSFSSPPKNLSVYNTLKAANILHYEYCVKEFQSNDIYFGIQKLVSGFLTGRIFMILLIYLFLVEMLIMKRIFKVILLIKNINKLI